VRILFVLDACDREIIAWSAVAQAGISGEMVRDLMVTAVERRFGTTKVPQPVEWLSDNGSAYIAKETADTARVLGLTLLFRLLQTRICTDESARHSAKNDPNSAASSLGTSSAMW
jgi:transposase InsO family protein